MHPPLPLQVAHCSRMQAPPSAQFSALDVPVWEEKGRWCLKPSKTCIKRTVELYAPCFVSTAILLILFTWRSIAYGVDAHAAIPLLCIPVHFVLMRLAIPRSPKYLAAVVWLQSLVVTGFIAWSLDGMARLEAQRLRAAFLAGAVGLPGPVPATPGTRSRDEALFWQMHADNPSGNTFLPAFMVVLLLWMLIWLLYICSQVERGFSLCSWQVIGSVATLVLNLLVFCTGLALSQNDYHLTQWGICVAAFYVLVIHRFLKYVKLVHDVQRHAQELSSQKASQEHADSVLNHVLKNIMVWACAGTPRPQSKCCPAGRHPPAPPPPHPEF